MVVTLSSGNFVDAATMSGIEIFQVQVSGAARTFDADGRKMTSLVNHRGSDNLTVVTWSGGTTIALDRYQQQYYKCDIQKCCFGWIRRYCF